jgi:hypothetical protein
MSSPHFYSLNQAVFWLQQLYEKQKKSKPDALFDIKKYICYETMPVYHELILSDALLCHYATKLFSSPDADIKLIKKCLASREHCSEVTFEINHEEKVFFIKQAWEGAIKEAIGLEFNNLLTDTSIRYLCGSEIIITEKIFEPLPADTLYQLRESTDYIFAYGAWEIFTKILRLTDRKTSNVRWNGTRLANIDFGLVFYKGNPVFDSRFTLTENTELRKQGQVFALKCLLSNFQQHQDKLERLLLNIDVHFCRSIPCSRIPREPLKVFLAALKEITPEIQMEIAYENKALKNASASILKYFQDTGGVLYVAIMTNKGMIIDEAKSSDYRYDYELKNQNSDISLKNSLVNKHLLDLIIAAKDNSILNTENQSIQIDLTEGRLLVLWNKNNGFMVLSLLNMDVSVAHIKANMHKLLENFLIM